jgi:hypothetical protein
MTKYLTFKNLFMLGMFIALIYMLTCKNQVPSIPAIKTIKEQVEVVKHDSIVSQHYKDSVQTIITGLERSANKWYMDWKVLANEYSLLEGGMNDLLTMPVPDTCKEIQNRLLAQFNKVIQTNRLKDTACVQTIAAKDGIIANKDKLIANSREDYRKLRINLDTCFAQQSKLEKAARQLRPKGEVYFGLTGVTSYESFSPTLGLSIGYRTKKGIQVELGGTLKKDIFLSIKKPLFKL